MVRYTIRDLIVLVAVSAVWLYVVCRVSLFAIPTLLAILCVSLHISAVQSLRHITGANEAPGPKIYLGPVKSVYFALTLCSVFSVASAALASMGILLRPHAQSDFLASLPEFALFMWRLLTDRSFVGRVSSLVSSQSDFVWSGLSEPELWASAGSLWAFVAFPMAVWLWYLVRLRWRIPMLVLAFDGLLVRRNTHNWVDFVPWGAIAALGEGRLVLSSIIRVRLHDPALLYLQGSLFRRFIWRFNRKHYDFDFCFSSSGWNGLTGKSLLQELQMYLAEPERRCLLIGTWKDERVHQWYDRAKTNWAEQRVSKRGAKDCHEGISPIISP